jgi:superfamily II DNA or RNA helicase
MSITVESQRLSAADKRALRERLRLCDDDVKPARKRAYRPYNPAGTDSRLRDGICLADDGTTTRIPFAFALEETTFTDTLRNAPFEMATTPLTFAGELRDEQTVVVDEALGDLEQQRSTIIASYPGFGKTCVAIIIATRLNLPTLIVTNKRVLVDQWKAAIDKYVGVGHTQVVTSATRSLGDNFQFYIVTASIIARLQPAVRYSDRIQQLLIVDELHLIMTPTLCYNLLHVSPRYIIGLSATPYRLDGYHPAIRWFFGDRERGKPLWRRHKVYCIPTGFKPTIKRQWNGDLDWSTVIESQSQNAERNRMIVDRVCALVPQRTWQVLTKRVAHVETLRDAFTARGVRCATLYGNQRTFDAVGCNVLVGTTPKIGVGFDWQAADALCMAADVASYFVQFLGRCMRCKEQDGVVPIVIDFIDDFEPLRKHFEMRRAVYLKHGGEMRYLRAHWGQTAPTPVAVLPREPSLLLASVAFEEAKDDDA